VDPRAAAFPQRSCGWGAMRGEPLCGDYPSMQPSYGVVWREEGGEPATGKLELLPRTVRLDGRDGLQEIAYEDVAAIRIGRSRAARGNCGPRGCVMRRGGDGGMSSAA